MASLLSHASPNSKSYRLVNYAPKLEARKVTKEIVCLWRDRCLSIGFDCGLCFGRAFLNLIGLHGGLSLLKRTKVTYGKLNS